MDNLLQIGKVALHNIDNTTGENKAGEDGK
jgi:hypothetical protein